MSVVLTELFCEFFKWRCRVNAVVSMQLPCEEKWGVKNSNLDIFSTNWRHVRPSLCSVFCVNDASAERHEKVWRRTTDAHTLWLHLKLASLSLKCFLIMSLLEVTLPWSRGPGFGLKPAPVALLTEALRVSNGCVIFHRLLWIECPDRTVLLGRRVRWKVFSR